MVTWDCFQDVNYQLFLFLVFLERLEMVQEGRNRPPLPNASRKELFNKFQVVSKEE